MRIRPASPLPRALVALAAAAPLALGLATGPAEASSPAMARPHTPYAIGHRGVPVQAPENTLASIDRAARLGIGWVENDVQRTKDGALVVIHDTTLTRTTDVRKRFPDRAPWRVGDFTLAEIRKLDAGSWFGHRFAGEKVPTLDRYLRRVDHNRQRLLLEIKAPELYPGVERQIADTLRRTGWLDRRHVGGRLVVQSFSAPSLKAFHALRPEVRTGFLGAPRATDLPRYAAFADQINPDHTKVTADWVRKVHGLTGPHGRRLEISAWTVDDPRRAVALARMGVDAIISNAAHVVAGALADDADEDADAVPAPADALG
ncbi:glycerophosphodiester phosphodiesterase [Streptomyces caatingaensis]|uniref:Glycerophosphodiester phosphodiesterase n=1 Tax=Streptomyces caatingaensis TaxID=1678637 RepID=A0A0K9XIX0_9ACTN|nr:glycerophosphodiester phosphodiesterase family protein [Streptomyces caatingaensis]KNB52617.1 glycerophosphodiester phosphodiesterase [Streptomyces caatingaensis]